MKVIYFDRNVFDHICKLNSGITEEDVSRIRNAVESGIITIPASYTVIEETIPLIRVSDEAYEQHVQTVFSLIDKDRIIKAHHDLLKEDCESYAFRTPLSPRTTETSEDFKQLF